MSRVCANCNHPIGNLEQCFQWQSHIVCARCIHLLPQAPPTRAAPPAVPRVQTIERTGKQWKAYGCLGAIATLTGTILVFAGYSMGNVPLTAAGGISIAAGFLLLLIARIGAWWYHG